MMRNLFPAALFALAACTPLAIAQDKPKSGVVFSEDFEHFDAKRWDDITEKTIQIVEGGHSGKCLQVTAALGQDTGGHLYKMLQPGLEEAHLRFYVKFDAEHDYVHHFVNLVG